MKGVESKVNFSEWINKKIDLVGGNKKKLKDGGRGWEGKMLRSKLVEIKCNKIATIWVVKKLKNLSGK